MLHPASLLTEGKLSYYSFFIQEIIKVDPYVQFVKRRISNQFWKDKYKSFFIASISTNNCYT